MGITRDYFAIQQFYDKKYGDKTVCVIQIGKFYEVYEFDPNQADQIVETDERPGSVALQLALKDHQRSDLSVEEKVDTSQSIGHAVELSMILRMKLTSKNKTKPHTLDNPYLIGFPYPVYENHRDIILLHGYTIVRIDQKDKDSESENVERVVVEISSSATEIDNPFTIQPTGTNCIASIYIECQKTKKSFESNVVVCGLSCLDVSTGRNVVSEVYSKENDPIHGVHEIYRFLISQQPIELILHINKLPPDQIDPYLKYLHETLELEKYPTRVIRCNEIDPNFLAAEYQEEFLRKVFKSNQQSEILQPGTSNVIDDLDLEMFHYGRVSYLVLLQYCYEHNETLIRKLQKPQAKWSNEKNLILTHNALNQLDIFPRQMGFNMLRQKSKTYDSLISVLDNTSTELGSRFLRRQLLTPITDIEKLESYYAMTTDLMADTTLLQTIEQGLKKVPDIERLQRKVEMNAIKPREFCQLFKGYVYIRDIYCALFNACFNSDGQNRIALRELFMSEREVTEFNETIQQVYATVNFDKLNQVKFTSRLGGKAQKLESDDSFIHLSCDSELDLIGQQLQQYQNWLQAICDHLNSLIPNTRGKKIEPSFIRDKKNEDEEDSPINVSIYTTPHKAKLIKQACIGSPGYNSVCGSLEFHEMRSKTMITSDLIRQCCSGLETAQIYLEQKLLAKFYEIVAQVGTKTYFTALNNFVALLDFLKTNARNALKFKYYRPQINKESKNSYIQITGLRHPLIERIIRSEYIANDITLGNQPQGMLLFGVNSSGKSSFAKAVGIAVMMAQAGMFVAGNMIYSPYTKIITRLSGHDDILKGQSSFVVEMSELRTILRNSDTGTLILGDELCRGTESASGASLTIATLETLIARNSSFIFSTHMHHLPQIDIVQEFRKQNKLRIAHLAATYDATLDALTYERHLNDGPGSSLYGLEVCKSLSIDRAFIDRANSIRRSLENLPEKFHSTKKSRYNSRVYVDKCSLCSTTLNLQTHHIQEQSKADDQGYIETYHKNSAFNLLVLCQSCHTQLHATGTELVPKQTLNGVYLTPNVQVSTR